MSDTIAAIATGGTISAIGIIRISGGDAITAADKVFRASSGIRLTDAGNRRMYYGELTGVDGGLIDLCLCMVSRGPDSYTGEDTVELHCHGSPLVLSEALRVLFSHGIRQAEAGEFTKRGFLNGRMDLTRAEAVIDLIESETAAAAQNAAGQLRGAIAVRLEAVYSGLLDIMAHFHAVIDYPDQDIDDFKMQTYLATLRNAREELERMLSTHERGKILRDGVATAIIGRPNTGKSSLLNALVGYDRAIVTEFPGTTRDTIEEKILIGGILLRLIDTAGLRKPNDTIEQLGIGRTLDALRDAGLAILVLDGSEPLRDEDYDALRSIPAGLPKLVVINKSDLPCGMQPDALAKYDINYCRVSALTGAGFDSFDAEIERMFPDLGVQPSGEVITNARQADAISRALNSVCYAISAIEMAVTPDAVLTDIESALATIGEVTGKTMRDDIISRIFERFCVGK